MRLSLLFLLVFLLAAPCAAGENVFYPELSDPVDQRVQRLAIMFQRDDPFWEYPYNKDYLNGRGCQPLSMANGIIAAFGVTDYDTAVQITLESTELLVPRENWTRGPVLAELLPSALDPVLLAADERHPATAGVVCAYPGAISATADALGASEAIQLLRMQTAPAIVSFRMAVNPSWEDAIRVIFALHDMGMDDAQLIITRAGAGKESHGTPLASGKTGHYLSALIHVGRFMKDCSVYILDSLPRAIPGEDDETSVPGSFYRARYPFGTQREDNRFNRTFAPARISPCVIRLSLRDTSGLTGKTSEEQLALRTDKMNPFILFGAGSVLVTLPDKAQ